MITEILKVKLADLSFDLAVQKCLEIEEVFFFVFLTLTLYTSAFTATLWALLYSRLFFSTSYDPVRWRGISHQR